MSIPQADGNGSVPRRERKRRTQSSWMDVKQTGCCSDAQADGVPCDAVDCNCESCTLTKLTPPSRSAGGR